MTSLMRKIDEEARQWEKTKDEKHKENWYKLLKKFSKNMIKINRDRGTYLATGISLDLSDDGQPSDDSRREGGAF